jgi:hypothetical protein
MKVPSRSGHLAVKAWLTEEAGDLNLDGNSDVTLWEDVRPSDAARGKVGLASGMASRCTAGTAM